VQVVAKLVVLETQPAGGCGLVAVGLGQGVVNECSLVAFDALVESAPGVTLAVIVPVIAACLT